MTTTFAKADGILALREPATGDTAYFLVRWARLIQSLDQPYQFSIYDYEDDLSARTILDELITLLGDSNEVQDLRAILEPLDALFLARTQPRQLPESNSWLNRVPLLTGEEMRRDLAGER